MYRILALLALATVTLSGYAARGETTVTSSYDATTKKITYSVNSDVQFTDFHIRFSSLIYKAAAFTPTTQPTGWETPTKTKTGNDITISFKDTDGSHPVTAGTFVVWFHGSDPITSVGGTDWEVTNDNGVGTPFDEDNAGVVAHADNDQDVGHFASYGGGGCRKICPHVYSNEQWCESLLCFSFYVVQDTEVYECVYDIQGRLVRDYGIHHLSAGPHLRIWNGLDDRNIPAASGVYFIVARAGSEVITEKIVLLR